jgi:hypothetical protein
MLVTNLLQRTFIDTTCCDVTFCNNVSLVVINVIATEE